jgi:arylsulfatase A-like enzyme
MDIKQTSTILFAASCCTMLHAQKENPGKPNVVFILVDDYGWKDVSYNGSTFYETPNIDRLASEGMQFTNGYAAAPVSSPTRVSILTGKYPARTHITDWIPGYQYGLDEERLSSYKLISPPMVLNMPLSEVTIAEAMKEGGYSTYWVGKWHCSEDEEFYPQYQGFDVNIGGWLKGSPSGKRRVGNEGGAYYTPYNNPYLPDGPEGEFLTDRLGNEAVKLIESSKDKPFFLYLSFYAVHTPIEAKSEKTAYFREKAKRLGIDKKEPFTQEVDWYRNAGRKAWHWKERTVQSDPEYAALISSMDENVGKVLDCLRENGLDENTIVCFTSDNGGLSTAEGSPTTNAPLRGGKGWLYEGGIREPYIIKYPPVVKAGSSCPVPVVSTDFYPTLLELAGLPQRPEQHCDGVSIVPLLKGKKQSRGALYFHYPNYGGKGDTPSGAIREGDYKLLEFFEDGHTELYNLKEDISESNDLSEKQPVRTTKMLRQLQEWRKQCGALMPAKNENYKK